MLGDDASGHSRRGNKKRKRTDKEVESESDEDDEANWEKRYNELVEHKKRYKNLKIPSKQVKLARWAKENRDKYNQGLLEDRHIKKLNEIGFVWRVSEREQGNVTEKRLMELWEFKQKFGHTNVPQKYKENRKLANWVSNIRWKRRYINSTPLPGDVIRRLDEMAFEWDPMHSKERKSVNLKDLAVLSTLAEASMGQGTNQRDSTVDHNSPESVEDIRNTGSVVVTAHMNNVNSLAYVGHPSPNSVGNVSYVETGGNHHIDEVTSVGTVNGMGNVSYVNVHGDVGSAGMAFVSGLGSMGAIPFVTNGIDTSPGVGDVSNMGHGIVNSTDVMATNTNTTTINLGHTTVVINGGTTTTSSATANTATSRPN